MQQKEVIPVLFYDGDCGLCDRAVAFILKHEKNHLLHFASLQSKYAVDLIQDQAPQLKGVDSIILYVNGQFYIKSKAVIYLSKYLKFPFNCISFINIFPRSFSDWCYGLIAKNRHRFFAEGNHCTILNKETKDRFIE